MSRILIFGGSGFIGSSFKQYAMEQGDVVDAPTHNEVDILSPIKGFSGYDEVYNFASYATTSYIIDNPWTIIDLNINGTKNIIDLAKSMNSKLFFASSVAVYNETQSKHSCYEQSKRLAETMVLDSGLNYIISRLPSIYGPNMKSDHVIYKFTYDRGVTIYNEDNMIQIAHLHHVVPIIYNYMKSYSNKFTKLDNVVQEYTIKQLKEKCDNGELL